MRRLLQAACACLTLMLALPVLAQDALELSLPQARQMAGEALQDDNLDLAEKLALGLVQANPKDPYPYSILTAVHTRRGNADLARAAARLRYKYAADADEKFAAAHIAGQVAFQQARFTAAQIWLRRAALHADSEEDNKVLERDYAQVRNQNPFQFVITGAITPSDNVNNGASSSTETVNGQPTFAFIAPGSLALSGQVATLDVKLGYRLAATPLSQTLLSTRLYSRQVWLSEDAQASVPSLSNEDFGVTYADVSFDRSFRINSGGDFGTYQVALGRVWASGDPIYDLVRLSGRRGFRLGQATILSFDASHEWRLSEIHPDLDANALRLGAGLRHSLGNSDVISLSLGFEDVSTEALNGEFDNLSLRLGYSFGQNWGPVKVSTGLSVARKHYSEFERFLPVEGGRTDDTVTADLTLLFTELDVAGFIPSVQFTSRRTTSNLSRFSTEEFGVGFGIRSKF